jgi:hypothetical protein
MSGVRMAIKLIYLPIKETCMSTSPVIGGYLHLSDLPPNYEICVMTSTLIEGYIQFYECSSELLKCVQKIENFRYSVYYVIENKYSGWFFPT